MKELFHGNLVRLTSAEPDELAKAEARWQQDSEFYRLVDSDPIRLSSEKRTREHFTEHRVDRGLDPEFFSFHVRTLDDDRLIGFLGMRVDLIHSDAMLGLGIGERDFWNKGYGTDMVKVCLRYAFSELGLQRVSLGVMAYNARAQRSYEKAGFRLEGRTRQDVQREGKRTDTLWMGILREEWLALQNGENA
jgi:RimJ/RimL family protein N-acetyltransferase